MLGWILYNSFLINAIFFTCLNLALLWCRINYILLTWSKFITLIKWNNLRNNSRFLSWNTTCSSNLRWLNLNNLTLSCCSNRWILLFLFLLLLLLLLIQYLLIRNYYFIRNCLFAFINNRLIKQIMFFIGC